MRMAIRITLMAILVVAGQLALGGGGEALAGHRGAEPGAGRSIWHDLAYPLYGGHGEFRAWQPWQSAQYNKRDRRRRSRGRRNDHDRARDAVRRGQALPLAQIISGLRNRCPGTFLDAALVKTRQGLAYRVRILRRSGRRVTLLVDAGTGAVVGGRCN